MKPNPLHDPLAALQFAVEFAQTDIDALAPAEYLALQRDVRAFINREWRPKDVPPLSSVDDETLLLFQKRAIEMLREILLGEDRVTLSDDLVLSFWCFRDRSGVRVVAMGSPLYRLLYQLVRVLEARAPASSQRRGAPLVEKLRACPECGRLFVKVTKKRFCSTRCQSRVYMRGYRKPEKE